MKNAIYLLKKSQNENTTQSSNIFVLYVIDLLKAFKISNEKIAQLVENKEKLGTEDFVK